MKCLYVLLLLFKYSVSEQFRCDYEFSIFGQGWFKHQEIPATWYDARLRCALEGAILASPINPYILTQLKNEIFKLGNNSANNEFFVGIHATFSKGDYTSVEGIPLAQILHRWEEGEPNNLLNEESCLALSRNALLIDLSCNETRPYFCYKPENTAKEIKECGTADPDYHLDETTGSCYKYHTLKRTFSRASFACSAEGGHLAVINSEKEAEAIRQVFKNNGPRFTKQMALIGFTDWNERDEWRTIHGQTLEEAGYSKFAEGEPNNYEGLGEYCGSVDSTGHLNDVSCDVPHDFICEKYPDHPEICNDRNERL